MAVPKICRQIFGTISDGPEDLRKFIPKFMLNYKLYTNFPELSQKGIIEIKGKVEWKVLMIMAYLFVRLAFYFHLPSFKQKWSILYQNCIHIPYNCSGPLMVDPNIQKCMFGSTGSGPEHSFLNVPKHSFLNVRDHCQLSRTFIFKCPMQWSWTFIFECLWPLAVVPNIRFLMFGTTGSGPEQL